MARCHTLLWLCAPTAYRRLLGFMSNSSLKHLLKYEGDVKPTSYAISDTLFSVFPTAGEPSLVAPCVAAPPVSGRSEPSPFYITARAKALSLRPVAPPRSRCRRGSLVSLCVVYLRTSCLPRSASPLPPSPACRQQTPKRSNYARTHQILDAREQYLTRERLRDIRVGTRVVALLALFG